MWGIDIVFKTSLKVPTMDSMKELLFLYLGQFLKEKSVSSYQIA